jgi:hypothetical protein
LTTARLSFAERPNVLKMGKTPHPTPHTPHPAPTKNFLPQTLINDKKRVNPVHPPTIIHKKSLIAFFSVTTTTIEGRTLFTIAGLVNFN